MSNLVWNKNIALEQLDGDEELLEELVVLFQESMAADLELMQGAVENKDAQLVLRTAHNIKGAAASLGMETIRHLALLVEEQARQNSLTAAKEHLPALYKLLDEVRTFA